MGRLKNKLSASVKLGEYMDRLEELKDRAKVSGFRAEVLAKSVGVGAEILTFQLKYPRFIHSEMMTHRVFSRNASSSRAIPQTTMLKQCNAHPIYWGENQSGMSAGGEDMTMASKAAHRWAQARESAKDFSSSFGNVHKQVVNRITEPFQFITVVVSSTEWANFYKLRLDPGAQPEIRALAGLMQDAAEAKAPAILDVGGWHLPYYKDGSWIEARNAGVDGYGHTLDEAKAISIACCARTSYLNHDKSDRTLESDVKLVKLLAKMEHMSPFEHQASPMPLSAVNITPNLDIEFSEGVTHFCRRGGIWSGNFKGWLQLRQMESLYKETLA